MRKATLDEKGRVIKLEPVKEELSQEAQERRARQREAVAEKFGLNKGTK